MKYISSLTDELKTKILNFLYKDELFNVFLIHFIENQTEDMGQLYIEESVKNVTNVLHIKFDGNAYFTSFCAKNENGYSEIAKQLQMLNYNKILLSGKRKDVAKILTYLGKEITSAPDIYYKFDINACLEKLSHPDLNFGRATCSEEDIYRIGEFVVDFFNPENEQGAEDLINRTKLLEDIKLGVFLLEHKGQSIGMARYSGKTRNFADITTVYICPNYRGKGFGKKLIECMVQNIISESRVPVLQASSLNRIARRTYESLGFINQEEYSFEFIS